MAKSKRPSQRTTKCVSPQTDSADRSDLLWGAEQIAAYIGRDKRSVFYMAAHGLLPIKKIGSRLCASKRQLDGIAEVSN